MARFSLLSTLILSAIAITANTSVSAQAKLSVADQLRLANRALTQAELTADELSSHTLLRGAISADQETVDLIVRFADDDALAAMEANGATLVARVSSHGAVVSVPVSRATEVAASKGVRAASLSIPVKPTNMAARAATNVDKVLQGIDLPSAYTGEGVVVGLFDTGISPNHINFFDSAGNSRVSRVWYFPGSKSTATEYGGDSGNDVSTFVTDSRNESHGTHVLGIMAGSFADPADPSHDYRGVAPGSEIVVSCGTGYDAQILVGTSNIVNYAKSVGKPCVVNLSFGDNIGPHDGTDTFTATLNEIAEENDAVICMAAGNEREDPIAYVKTLSDNDTELRTLLLPTVDLQYNGVLYQGVGQVQVWGEDATPFDVSLEVVSLSDVKTPLYTFNVPTDTPTYVVQGTNYLNYFQNPEDATILDNESGFNTYYSESYMGGVRGVNANNGSYYADMNVFLASKSQSYASTYYVCLHVKGAVGKKLYVYCDGYYINFGTKQIADMEQFTGEGTNSNMASGKETLSVGSYVSANVSGSYYSAAKIGAPSSFSSYGETSDGRIMPDVCAPGQTIISSRNTNLTGNNYYPSHYSYTKDGKTYHWTSGAGTSQASPHMAGIAALWLSANPALTHREIQTIARETASVPYDGNVGWGYGKVDAYEGLKRAIGLTSVANVFNNADEQVIIHRQSDHSYEVYAPGQADVTATLTNMCGITVAAQTSNNESLALSTTGITPGIYVLKVTTPRAYKAIKIVVSE